MLCILSLFGATFSTSSKNRHLLFVGPGRLWISDLGVVAHAWRKPHATQIQRKPGLLPKISTSVTVFFCLCLSLCFGDFHLKAIFTVFSPGLMNYLLEVFQVTRYLLNELSLETKTLKLFSQARGFQLAGHQSLGMGWEGCEVC